MPKLKCLSERQKEVVQHLIKGHTNKQIGELMNVSEKTVTFHLTDIFQKEGVNNRLELAAKYLNPASKPFKEGPLPGGV